MKEEFDKLVKSKYPVCGMEVDVELIKWVSKYKNKDYYFWSLICKEEFDENPEKYVKD
jgi:YHS domain-containing protein